MAALRSLQRLEALAVGALIHSGICFVGTDLNALQTAVCLAGAVVCALLDAAADRTVRGAGAALFGMLSHCLVLLVVGFFRHLPMLVYAHRKRFMYRDVQIGVYRGV